MAFNDFLYSLLNSGQQRHPGIGGGMPETVNKLAAPQPPAPQNALAGAMQGGGVSAPMSQPQQAQSAPQSSGGGFFEGLGNLIQDAIDPEARGRNQTIDWLQQQGLDAGTATLLAGNKPALQKYLLDRRQGQQPDYSFMNIDGTLVRTDSFGNAVPVGQFGRDEPSTRPMTPTERLKWGIPQDDKRPYAMSEDGPKLIGGSGVTVNTSYSGEKGYDKTVGEGYGKRFMDMQEDANSARRTLTGLDVMQQAMSDENFYSGSGATYVNGLKRLGASIGINPDSVSSAETFNAMSKQAALDNMGGSLGSGFSNADRDFVTDQVPSLQNAPAGNTKLIGILRKIATRKQEAAQLARDYAADHGGRIDAGFDDYLSKWAGAHPLFPTPPQGSGAARGAGGAMGRQRARNPTTGETVEWNGQQWVPAQ